MKITHATYLVSDELIARRFLSKVFGFVVIEEGLAVDGKKFLALGAPGGANFNASSGLDVRPKHRRISQSVKEAEGGMRLVEVTDVYACREKVVDFGLFLRKRASEAHHEYSDFLKTPLEICGTLFKEAHLSEIIRYTWTNLIERLNFARRNQCQT